MVPTNVKARGAPDHFHPKKVKEGKEKEADGKKEKEVPIRLLAGKIGGKLYLRPEGGKGGEKGGGKVYFHSTG